MKLMFAFIALASSVSVLAEQPVGPFPHERTDTPKLKNATTGRYIYLGDVPKFDGQDLELTVAKMSLTTRVTAHVTQRRIDTYASDLYLRWKNFNDALNDSAISLHPLVTLSKLAEGKPDAVKAWTKIADQYSEHVLAATGLPVHAQKRNAKNFSSNQERDSYKKTIAEAYFRLLFQTREPSELVVNDNQKLTQLLSVPNSRRLFAQKLGANFTADAGRAGYVGYLTFVYPIAATVKGPFDQPKEMITDMKTAESIEARWWSNLWKDEFAGMPFLLIEYSGVAFHAPITNYGPLDVWFLKRGYVSHGCHRMDSSDVLELRSLFPTDLRKAAGQIKITILNHFDVVDWNKDGKLEAVDVKYYNIPSQVDPKTLDISPYLVENQKHEFYLKNKYAAKFYDAASESLVNVPKYVEVAKKLKTDGVHARVPLYRFNYRPSRVIQYVEENVNETGFDDTTGRYPPRYFQKY